MDLGQSQSLASKVFAMKYVFPSGFFIAINLFVSVGQAEPPGIGPTFSNSVAKIVYERCTSCHRSGQSGPFELIRYEDVVKRSETIREVVNSRYMPPWKPSDVGISYAHDRRCSEEEVRAINDWIAAGCPLGDASSVPPPPKYSSDWALGQPDLVVKMASVFEVPAEGPDLYRSFVLPVGLKEDRWIKAMELRPTARGAVHHALFFVDADGTLRSQRENDGKPGFRGMNFLRGGGSSDPLGRLTEGASRGLGGYVPGATPNRLPGDLARFLPAGSDIVMQTHFHPTGKVEQEQSELALYFADHPPAQRLVPLQLPALFGAGANLDVPAGESEFHLRDEYVLSTDVLAYEVMGHAHYICSKMTMTAHLPGGKSLELLKIEDWDLDWQDQYQFAHAIELPQGTRIAVDIVYDNSSNNPENPNSPPKRIAWGRESNDEMGSMTLIVVAKDESKRPKLEQDMMSRSREAIRGRIKNQASRSGPLASLLGDGAALALLDKNRNGKLEEDELPERVRSRLMEWVDRNRDQSLDKEEIEASRKWMQEMMKDSNEESPGDKGAGSRSLRERLLDRLPSSSRKGNGGDR